MGFRVQGFKIPLLVQASMLRLLRDLTLSYYNKETIQFTVDPYCGNLNKTPKP